MAERRYPIVDGDIEPMVRKGKEVLAQRKRVQEMNRRVIGKPLMDLKVLAAIAKFKKDRYELGQAITQAIQTVNAVEDKICDTSVEMDTLSGRFNAPDPSAKLPEPQALENALIIVMAAYGNVDRIRDASPQAKFKLFNLELAECRRKSEDMSAKFQSQLAEAVKAVPDLTTEIAGLKSSNQAYEEKICTLNKEIFDLNMEWQTKYTNLQEVLNVRTDARNDLQSKLTFRTSESETSKKRLAAGISERDTLQTKLNSRTAERDEFEERLRTCTSERYELEDRVKSRRTEKDGFEKQLIACISERDGFKGRLKNHTERQYELEEHLKTRTLERDEFAKRLNACISERDKFEGRLKNRTEGQHELKARFKTCTLERDEFSKRLNACISERDGFEGRLKTHMERQHDLEERLQTRTLERDESEKRLEARTKERDELEERLKIISAERDRFKQTLETRTDERNGFRQNLVTRTAERDGYYQNLETRTTERDGFERSLSARTIERDECKRYLEIRTTERDNLRGILNTRIEEWNRLQQSLAVRTSERDSNRTFERDHIQTITDSNNGMSASSLGRQTDPWEMQKVYTSLKNLISSLLVGREGNSLCHKTVVKELEAFTGNLSQNLSIRERQAYSIIAQVSNQDDHIANSTPMYMILQLVIALNKSTVSHASTLVLLKQLTFSIWKYPNSTFQKLLGHCIELFASKPVDRTDVYALIGISISQILKIVQKQPNPTKTSFNH